MSGSWLRLAALALIVTSRALAADVAPLEGIWVARVPAPASLKGSLSVARVRGTWVGRLAGERAVEIPGAGELVLEFPGHAGTLRASLASDRHAIEGFWVQPPRGADPALATPVSLRIGPGGIYRGTIVPLEEGFTLYLEVFRGADGAWLGAFRNPERNSRGGAAQFHVSTDADRVRFEAVSTAERRPQLEATWQRDPERLLIEWPDAGQRLALERASPLLADRFWARPRSAAPYRYRRPAATGDGWKAAAAGRLGLDEGALAALVERLARVDPASPRSPLVHSLLIAYRGKLVLEEYFFGHAREQTHDLRSASKTFASVMLGTAMRQGLPIQPATRVLPLFDPQRPFAAPDPRKGAITIAQLLTHTSGLACDDANDDSPGNEDTMQSQGAQPDWARYTLNLPMAHDPGAVYAYCSGGTNVVGAAITRASGTWLPEWFERTVARPLQFGRYYWNLMPNGEGYAGGGARLRPRDLLKIGELYLDGGTWRGRRLLDASWVASSTLERQPITPATTGLSPERFRDSYLEAVDGYAWHASTLESGGRRYREYAATGNGGQVLSVVPELSLAVVFTAGNYGQGGIWTRFRPEFVGGAIIAAARH